MVVSVVAHAVLLASVADPTPALVSLAVRRIDAQLVARPVSAVTPDTPGAAAPAHETVSAVQPPASGVRPSVVDSGRGRENARSVRRESGASSVRRAPPSESPVRSPAGKAPPTLARPPDGLSGSDALSAAAVAAESGAFDAVSAEAMRRYRMDLALAASGVHAYPDVARARGWQGTVEVVLETRIRSPEPRVSLWRSSGYAALDAQAVDTLARAARATPLPAALRTRELRVVVAVRFDLDGER
jgi:protein TonB